MAVVITDLLMGAGVKATNSTIGVAPGVTVAVGEIAVIFATCSANATAPTCADNAGGNTYTRQTALAFNGTSDSLCVFTCPASTAITASNTITVTFGLSSGAQAIYGFKVANGNTSSPVDINVTQTGSSTAPTHTGGTGTLAQADEAIFALAIIAQTDLDVFNFDAGNGWHNINNDSQTGTSGGTSNTNVFLNVQAQVVSSTSSVAWAPSLGTSGAWGVNMISIKGASQNIGIGWYSSFDVPDFGRKHTSY